MALLREVFRRMKENNLQAKISKCSFAQKETKYLGYVISKDTKKPDPAKVKAIKEMRPPTDKSEVRGVLGLAGFYRDFIKDFCGITKPLYDLLSPRTQSLHDGYNTQQQQAFAQLKKCHCNPSERSDAGDAWLNCLRERGITEWCGTVGLNGVSKPCSMGRLLRFSSMHRSSEFGEFHLTSLLFSALCSSLGCRWLHIYNLLFYIINLFII